MIADSDLKPLMLGKGDQCVCVVLILEANSASRWEGVRLP